MKPSELTPLSALVRAIMFSGRTFNGSRLCRNSRNLSRKLGKSIVPEPFMNIILGYQVPAWRLEHCPFFGIGRRCCTGTTFGRG